MIERFTDQLELPTLFKEAIRLKMTGLLIFVSVDREVLVQLLANSFFLRLWLPVAVSAVSSVTIFGEFNRDEFRVSCFMCSPSLAVFTAITLLFW